MRNRMKLGNSELFHVVAIAVLLVIVTINCATAHVMIDPVNAAPGAVIEAHFKVGHGCNGAATNGLAVEFPAGVTGVMAHDKPGWQVTLEKNGGRTILAWTGGSSAPDKPDSFAVMFTVPKAPVKLVFPATQTCGATQEHWSDVADGTGMPLKHPAPSLTVISTVVAAPVMVSDAWIRALPAALPSGGYFTLRNTGDKPVTLTGAESPACGMLMLHKSENQGGMTDMSQMAQVVVPAGGAVKFAPGGYHLMCTDAKALSPGTQVPVTLQFADGTALTASFAVKTAVGK